MLPARPQQTVCEHMPPFRIGAELNFVDGQKIDAHPFGHRLDGADPILGARRHDSLFAGDQRHNRRAPLGHDAVIDLARQQAQRQTDHAGAIAQHPLDGVMGLARIGRAENRHNA